MGCGGCCCCCRGRFRAPLHTHAVQHTARHQPWQTSTAACNCSCSCRCCCCHCCAGLHLLLSSQHVHLGGAAAAQKAAAATVALCQACHCRHCRCYYCRWCLLSVAGPLHWPYTVSALKAGVMQQHGMPRTSDVFNKRLAGQLYILLCRGIRTMTPRLLATRCYSAATRYVMRVTSVQNKTLCQSLPSCQSGPTRVFPRHAQKCCAHSFISQAAMCLFKHQLIWFQLPIHCFCNTRSATWQCTRGLEKQPGMTASSTWRGSFLLDQQSNGCGGSTRLNQYPYSLVSQ